MYVDTGEPIAWCISDRETTAVIEVLLRCMKERSPCVEVNILMTDDGMLCTIGGYKIQDNCTFVQCTYSIFLWSLWYLCSTLT